MQVPNQVQDHIDTIAKHEQEFLAAKIASGKAGRFNGGHRRQSGICRRSYPCLLFLDSGKHLAFAANSAF